MTDKRDGDAWMGAIAVLERHGDGACAFATERLEFCRSVAFADGIKLWTAILQELAIMTGQSADHAPRDDV